MTDVQDTVGTLAELFTWIGVIAGGLCFAALLVLRVARGAWADVEAVVIDDSGSFALRWMGSDGTLHDRPLSPAEVAAIPDQDSLRVYYRRHSPAVGSLQPVDDLEGVLRLLGLILLALAVVAILVSVIVMFIP